MRARIVGFPGAMRTPCTSTPGRPSWDKMSATISSRPTELPPEMITMSLARAFSTAARRRSGSSGTMPMRRGTPPSLRTALAREYALASRIWPGPGCRSGETSSSPLEMMATTGRRNTHGAVHPTAAKAPTSWGRSRWPERSTTRPAATSAPAGSTFSPGRTGAKTLTAAGSPPSPAPPAGSLLSTGSTASAPAGNMPPVGIQTASPGPTFTEGASPMRTCPRTVSTGAMPGSTGLVSAARTAQPSMVARAKAGTSASARTSRASTRPPASRSVTCSSGGRYGGRASRKRRKAPATVDRFFASKGFAASRTATASRGSGHCARTLDLALPIQAQRGCDGAQGIDDHLDVVVQVHPQLGGAPDKLVAVHAFRERFIFHLLLNGLDFHFVNALVGTHQSHRHHEAGHLIHRVQRLGHQVAPLEVEVIRVALDGVNDVLGVAQLLQDGGTLQRVVRRVRPALVVKIVQQTGDPPPLLV